MCFLVCSVNVWLFVWLEFLTWNLFAFPLKALIVVFWLLLLLVSLNHSDSWFFAHGLYFFPHHWKCRIWGSQLLDFSWWFVWCRYFIIYCIVFLPGNNLLLSRIFLDLFCRWFWPLFYFCSSFLLDSFYLAVGFRFVSSNFFFFHNLILSC